VIQVSKEKGKLLYTAPKAGSHITYNAQINIQYHELQLEAALIPSLFVHALNASFSIANRHH
jgi:hypothetical protein